MTDELTDEPKRKTIRDVEGWIAHAKSEKAPHVSVPVGVMEQLISEVVRVRALPAVATGTACLAENKIGFICTMEKGHSGPHRIVMSFEHIALLLQKAKRENASGETK